MGIPAVVAAGNRGAAKAVRGQNKVFLEVGGLPLVAHVVLALQDVAEVSSVSIVGDAERLGDLFAQPELRARLSKPLRVFEQFANLYENAWESYRRLLPGAGPAGRDPASVEDEESSVLYVSGDIPFATAHEITDFVHRVREADCDYALGLVPRESMADFRPVAPGQPGIEMASFNLREGRFRQSNLHLAKPARIGNRHYIEQLYRHRHQKELGQIATLAWRLFTTERGGFAVVWYYGLMHLAGFCDRRRWFRIADWVRRRIPMARIEKGCGSLLRTRFRFVVTEVGGAAIDIDTEEDYEAANARFAEWRAAQEERAGALAAEAGTGRDAPLVGTGRDAPLVGTGRDAPLVGTGRDAPLVGTGRDAPLVGTGRDAPRDDGDGS